MCSPRACTASAHHTKTVHRLEEALAAAVDLGGDTDTVAAVTGALAGAVYGIDAVPERWTAPLHVPLRGFGDRVLRLAELTDLAVALRRGQCFRPGG